MRPVEQAPGEVGRPSVRERIAAAMFDRMTRSREERLFAKRRRRLLETARGSVLDVGAGTGANVPHYPRGRVDRLVLLDVDRGMLARAGRRALAAGWQVELRRAGAERLPFPDASLQPALVRPHLLATARRPPA